MGLETTRDMGGEALRGGVHVYTSGEKDPRSPVSYLFLHDTGIFSVLGLRDPTCPGDRPRLPTPEDPRRDTVPETGEVPRCSSVEPRKIHPGLWEVLPPRPTQAQSLGT